MIRRIGKNRRGFTLIELLVVVAMIALIMGALSTSVSSAMQRARVQKATAEASSLMQAILAYENHDDSHELPTMRTWTIADKSNIGFILGDGGQSATRADIPVLIQAALTKSGVMRDPWGMPYYIMINEGNLPSAQADSIGTGYFLPNFYRLTEGERK